MKASKKERTVCLIAAASALAAATGGAFGLKTLQDAADGHMIANDADAIEDASIPYSRYIVFPYLGTAGCISFIGELKKLSELDGTGYFIVDLSSKGSSLSEIQKLYPSLTDEINYTVYETVEKTDQDTGKTISSKRLLYTTTGWKDAEALSSEIGYVAEFGIPTGFGQTVTIGGFSVTPKSCSIDAYSDGSASAMTVTAVIRSASQEQKRISSAWFYFESMGTSGSLLDASERERHYVLERDEIQISALGAASEEEPVPCTIKFTLPAGFESASVRLYLEGSRKTQEEYEAEKQDDAQGDAAEPSSSSESSSSEEASEGDDSREFIQLRIM
jgi:hypothetical protein